MNSMFGLNGIGGYLLAVVILLSALGYLGVYKAITIQNASAENPYTIVVDGKAAESQEDMYANLRALKMIDSSNRERVQVSK